MSKIKLRQRSRYLERCMNLFVVSCMVVHIILLFFTSHLDAKALSSSSLRPITWPEIESLLSKRSFVSQEELFQLLHLLYSQKQDMILLDKPIIQKLAGTTKSLLPLSGCESITLQDGTIKMTFDKPQDIYIPNSWYQASLKMSKHLVLRLEESKETKSPGEPFNPVEDDTKSVRFIIEQGSLKLDFSFLLKIFGNNIRNGKGSELLYQINDNKQISSLALIEKTSLTQQDLSINRQQPANKTDEYSWIDIHHADFPDTKDIGICTNKISLLGVEIELLSEERIRVGDEEPRQDSEAYHYFKTSLGRFQDLVFSENKPVKIDYTRTFGYKFEERKMFITMGFGSADDKNSIL